MADGSIIIDVDLDEKELSTKLRGLKSKIMSLEEKNAVTLNLKTDAEQKLAVLGAQLDAAKMKAEQFGNAEDVKPLQAQFDLLASKVEKYEAELAKGNEQIRVARQEYQELGATIQQTNVSAEQAPGILDKITNRVKGLIKRVLFFSIISAGLRALRNYLGEYLKSNDAFATAVSQLKGVLISAFSPIIDFVIPWITALIQIITRAIAIISSLVGALFGVSNGATSAAKSLNKQAGAGGKAAKSMAKFDEINQLGGNGGGGGGSATGADFGFDLKEKLSEYENILSGALLVIGAILAFSGANVPLGIALMAVGAVNLITSIFNIDWDTVKRFVQDNADAIVGIISGALLAIGAILAFSGANIPLGIALMAAGAAGLAKTVYTNWGKIVDYVSNNKEQISKIMSIGGAALLVLGVILTVAGVLPLGIGLIVAGAAGLATAAALNWDAIKAKIQDNKEEITNLMTIGGAALIVLGVILTVAGVLPVGIALIAAGAGSLAAVVALNWDAIVDKVKEVWDNIKGFWSNKIAPIFTAEFWAGKFASIKEGMKTALNGVITVVENAINWIVEKLNLINFDIPEWVPGIGGKSLGFNIPSVNIPRLAQGAVIPPNKEFMAVLGDQKSGTNIETPLETMVAAFREALAGGGASRDITVIFELDGQSFGRAVYRANNDETQRVGLRLAGG